VRQSSDDIYIHILTSTSHIRQKSIKADEDDSFSDAMIDTYDEALQRSLLGARTSVLPIHPRHSQ
jgi:hypothetical protein